MFNKKFFSRMEQATNLVRENPKMMTPTKIKFDSHEVKMINTFYTDDIIFTSARNTHNDTVKSSVKFLTLPFNGGSHMSEIPSIVNYFIEGTHFNGIFIQTLMRDTSSQQVCNQIKLEGAQIVAVYHCIDFITFGIQSMKTETASRSVSANKSTEGTAKILFDHPNQLAATDALIKSEEDWEEFSNREKKHILNLYNGKTPSGLSLKVSSSSGTEFTCTRDIMFFSWCAFNAYGTNYEFEKIIIPRISITLGPYEEQINGLKSLMNLSSSLSLTVSGSFLKSGDNHTVFEMIFKDCQLLVLSDLNSIIFTMITTAEQIGMSFSKISDTKNKEGTTSCVVKNSNLYYGF
jgi:hypothetical protein